MNRWRLVLLLCALVACKQQSESVPAPSVGSSAPTAPLPPAGWQVRASKLFTVTAPTTPTKQHVEAQGLAPAMDVYTYRASSDENLDITVSELGKQTRPDRAVMTMRDRITLTVAAVTEETSVTVGSDVGVDIKYRESDTEGPAWVSRTRIFARGPYGYEVRARYRKNVDRGADAARFVESFALTP